jgi:hypothetical protein
MSKSRTHSPEFKARFAREAITSLKTIRDASTIPGHYLEKLLKIYVKSAEKFQLLYWARLRAGWGRALVSC